MYRNLIISRIPLLRCTVIARCSLKDIHWPDQTQSVPAKESVQGRADQTQPVPAKESVQDRADQTYGSAANNKYCHFLSGGSRGGGCSPWMILSHMVQQQTTNTATFYQGVLWGVLTLKDIVSYGSAANNKYCHFLSGGSMGGAHLEWYCLIWFSNKQILSLFIRGFHGGGVLTLNDIVSYGSAANNKYCHFLSWGSMGGGVTLNDIVSYGSAANNKYCHFLSGFFFSLWNSTMLTTYLKQ